MHVLHKDNSKKEGAHRWPSASLLLTAVAVLAYYVPGISEAWVYNRCSGLGEAWRYLTCHWVHWNSDHLLWSTGTFLVLSVACEDIGRRLHGACVLLSALLIPVGLWLWSPSLATYGGLSGIDSALFGLLAVSIVRDAIAARKWTGAIAVGLFSTGFAAKIGYEMATGGTAFMNPTDVMIPVPLAHVFGVMVGVLVGLVGGYRDHFSGWLQACRIRLGVGNSTANAVQTIGIGNPCRLRKNVHQVATLPRLMRM